jgi:hypothetical protein
LRKTKYFKHFWAQEINGLGNTAMLEFHDHIGISVETLVAFFTKKLARNIS